MPAMKCRSCDHMSERPKSPSNIRVHKDRPERQNARCCAKNLKIESQQCQRRDNHHLSQSLIDGVEPHGRKPVQFFRSVMDSVEVPKPARGKQPARPLSTKDCSPRG